MTQEEREYMIQMLVIDRGWNPSAYENMADEDLQRAYNDMWKRRG